MVNLQHGDVILRGISSLPEGCKEVIRKGEKFIVAEGEMTGHNHVIVETGAKLLELKGELYLEVLEPVTITHEEHKAIAIPEGIYKIGRVQEHDYFEDMTRQVRD